MLQSATTDSSYIIFDKTTQLHSTLGIICTTEGNLLDCMLENMRRKETKERKKQTMNAESDGMR